MPFYSYFSIYPSLNYPILVAHFLFNAFPCAPVSAETILLKNDFAIFKGLLSLSLQEGSIKPISILLLRKSEIFQPLCLYNEDPYKILHS